MDLFSVSSDTLFSAMDNQYQQMESLANQALSGGIDKYIKKDYEGAAKDFKRAFGLSPYSNFSFDAIKYQSMAYEQLGQTNQAIEAYVQGLKVLPNDDRLHLELANVYFKEEEYGKAIEHYEEAVRLYDDVNNRFSLGQGYLKAGRYRDAENQFRKIIQRSPQGSSGYFGLGQTFAQQKKYAEAIDEFERAISKNHTLYSAYAEIGYAYADMQQFDKAEEIRSYLEHYDAGYADTLSRYINKQTKPRIEFAYANSTFKYFMKPRSTLAAMDAYLANASANRTVTMVFQFNKEMDRDSVENIMNWSIKRASGYGPAENYNFGQAVPETEVQIPFLPTNVYYNADNFTATVRFTLTQNEDASGTIDPMHVEFAFKGKDADGNDMDADYDQFTGFSKSF